MNAKQDILSRSSNVSINSLIVSNDTFSSGSVVPGQISCISLLIDGVNLDTSLNEKQNTLDPTSILSEDRVSTLGDITSGGDLMYFDIFWGLEMLEMFFLQLIQQLALNKI